MDAVREYLFGVITAALLCTLITALAGKSGMLSAVIKLLTGVFMTLTLASPLLQLKIQIPEALLGDVSLQAEAITASAENSSLIAISEIIKSETEAYILDKAKQMGADLTVQVMLDDGNPPKPAAVQMNGSVSPYVKSTLSGIIEEDLGIHSEAQTWN